MDKKIVLQDGVTFSYDNDGVVRDMSILDGVEKFSRRILVTSVVGQTAFLFKYINIVYDF